MSKTNPIKYVEKDRFRYWKLVLLFGIWLLWFICDLRFVYCDLNPSNSTFSPVFRKKCGTQCRVVICFRFGRRLAGFSGGKYYADSCLGADKYLYYCRQYKTGEYTAAYLFPKTVRQFFCRTIKTWGVFLRSFFPFYRPRLTVRFPDDNFAG